MRAQMKNRRKQFVLLIGLLVVGWALGGCELFWLVVPNVPTGVDASDGNYLDQIVVVWQSVARAVRYEIWRASSADGSYVQVGETTAATYSDTEITINATYWYKVKACNRAGCSELSEADSGHAAGTGFPAVPTGVSATDGAYLDRVRVTWTAAAGATQYQVWRDVAQGGPYNLRGTVTGTLYDDMDASPGVVYWYKVKACNTSGCSAFSTAESGFTFPSEPDPVTNVSASDGTLTDRVRITWTASLGAANYEVHRATSEGGEYTRLGTVPGTTYDDTTVTVGTTYWYRVKACNAVGCSAFSVPDAGFASTGGGGGGGGGGGTAPVPDQPGGVSATDGAFTDKVRVTWNAVSGATGYQIHRSDDGITFIQIGSTTTTRTYDDTYQATTGKPASCVEYWYAVRACNANGCGPMSVADKGYRGAPTPVPPSGVSASDGLHVDKITVTWNAVTGATRYEIYAQTSSNMYGTYGYVGQATTTTFHHTGLPSGVTYYYRVKSCVEGTGSSPGVCGCSSLSSFDQGSTCSIPAVPSAPTLSVVSPVPAGTICITWTMESGLRYELWRSSDGATYTRIAEYAASPYDDNVGSGNKRYYKLKACNACGCSDLSNEANDTAQ